MKSRPGEQLRFTFDGVAYQGVAGDTLAAALLANGVHLMGRSFKYHRPRGVVAAGAEEPNALVEIDRGRGRRTPNLRATQVELFDGLVARSQNRSPSLRFDIGAVNDLLSPFLTAGFYYKTFMWPASFWHSVYEPAIRRAAGLGRAPEGRDPDRYANRFAHCDLLVVGSGAAGLACAETASAAGARVILCDEQAAFGGALLDEPDATIDGTTARDWVRARIGALASRETVTLLSRTTAFGAYPQNFYGLAQRLTDHLPNPDPSLPRERMWQVRAKQVVLACGAIERPLVFPNNDRPGVMLAGAARAYAVRHGVAPGSRAAIATACDSGYAAAMALRAAGASIARIVDLRADPDPALVDAARAAGIRVETGATVLGTQGRLRISTVDIAHVDASGAISSRERIACDLLAVSGGWTPSLHLYSQARGKPVFDDASGTFVPGTNPIGQRSAGACRGVFGISHAIEDGAAAAADALAELGINASPYRATVAGETSMRGFHLGIAPCAEPVRAFVDFQNDVTAKDLKLATNEGFRSIEHIKRYTTTGMATDQGKTSNLNALAIVAKILDRPIPEIGLTTFRAPYTPVAFGTMAGYARDELFDPVRTTPIHDAAVQAGAVFEDVALWKRARYFPRAGETMDQAVARECRTVRERVGLFDASTLGKIEITGRDAAEFMNRLYVNPWTKLAPGRCRYGVMLGENGFVMDDGVVGRLADDRFHVTTTTGGAPRVLSHMEDYRQTEWPELDVWLTSTTEQWAVIGVQGPLAREILAPLVGDLDITAKSLPHMAVVEGKILGVPMRLFRVSFTGELGFEVNVPGEYGRAVWEAIAARVGEAGGCLYGTEAMHVLRAEKGFIIVGQESDGTATPSDLGLDWAIGKAKRDFVGKRSLARPDMLLANRRQLVGLLTEDGKTVLNEGAQITEAAARTGAHSLGHVTSSYGANSVGRPIALAMIEAGRARIGEVLHVGAVPVRLTAPVFHDPEGKRLDA